MSNTTAYHVTPSVNVNSIIANGLEPRIGRRSETAGEPEKAIYLFPTIEDCNNALMNWLGTDFENLEQECGHAIPLTILKAKISEYSMVVDWEYIVHGGIPPCDITIFAENQ